MHTLSLVTTKLRLTLLLGVAGCFFAPTAMAETSINLSGKWVTDRGVIEFSQDGSSINGKYGKDKSLSGKIKNNKLTIDFAESKLNGKATLQIAKDSKSFTGSWQSNRGRGSWRGWRAEPDAEKGEPIDFSGVWLTSWGTLQIEQDGDEVTGRYGAEGWSTITGTVKGSQLNLNWKRIRWSGKAWLQQSTDGKQLFGASVADPPSVWTGIKLDGYDLHADPKPGEAIQGRADNGMLYHLRMPDDWKPGDDVDVIVLLHGSNWTAKGMTWVTAKNWPDLGKKFAILGIQGQNWVKTSNLDDLRFNYNYVNWVGKSTYRGYPYTDRESPYLVSQVLDELQQQYKFQRIFVGGHSQGAYLTYILHMNYPDQITGSFPIAGGLIFQAEPSAYDKPELIAQQKSTPMAIIHGKNDRVVGFRSSEYAHEQFLAHGFPAVKLVTSDGGHGYDFLPVNEAITYLDVLTTDDPDTLIRWSNEQLESGNWRELGLAWSRARELGQSLEKCEAWASFEAEAAKDAGTLLDAITKNANGAWVNDYLAWQNLFSIADSAGATVAKFSKLQEQHDKVAKGLWSEATKAFRSGKRDEGYQKYQAIVETAYASKRYSAAKRALDKRK